jgi:predicted Ser/Thr protein kinase
MNATPDIPPELAGKWHGTVVLKQDVFSTVERGRFAAANGEVDAVLRRLDSVPWWSFILARHLFRRERRALAVVTPLKIAPELLYGGSHYLVRGFIDGVALHVARPKGDRAYFRSAREALRRLHRLGVTHNDLAKEQNWLRGGNGKAYLTDFQLAFVFRRRSKLFRLAAYEDLRHYLKHKRTYVPEALTAAEKKILARKSLPTRIWMATGKRVYRLVTRRVFGFIDREGGGPRLVNDAPVIVTALKQNAAVRDAAVVAFPDRRTGVGLYAFIEASSPYGEQDAARALANSGVAPPDRVQIVEALPRNASGLPRTEVLQLVAMNQVDLIDPLLTGDMERGVVARIVAGRQNLRDRFSF